MAQTWHKRGTETATPGGGMAPAWHRRGTGVAPRRGTDMAPTWHRYGTGCEMCLAGRAPYHSYNHGYNFSKRCSKSLKHCTNFVI